MRKERILCDNAEGSKSGKMQVLKWETMVFWSSQVNECSFNHLSSSGQYCSACSLVSAALPLIFNSHKGQLAGSASRRLLCLCQHSKAAEASADGLSS